MTAIRLAILVMALATFCARADTATATSCADGLSADARTIFDTTAPGVKTADDPRAFIKTKVVALVEAGRIGRFSARSNARAAGECLKMLR
jgi:ABC-type transporter MlaC component